MDMYESALTEVYFIINSFEDGMKSKIPNEIISAIRDRMDKKYIPNISNISKEANSILSVIYSEYICSEVEKTKWDEIDKLYKDSLLQNRSVKQSQMQKNTITNLNKLSEDENMALIETRKENILTIFFRKIKKFINGIWRK